MIRAVVESGVIRCDANNSAIFFDAMTTVLGMLHAKYVLVGRNVHFGEIDKTIPSQQVDLIGKDFQADRFPYLVRRSTFTAISALLCR